MLITAFNQFLPEGHWGPCSEVESLTLVEHLVGFEPGTFQIIGSALTQWATLPKLGFSRLFHLL